MKTKILAIILMVLALPAMLGMFFLLNISFGYLIGNGQEALAFAMGHANNMLITIISSLTLLFMASMLMYLIQMLKYANDIDKLEEERLKYTEAKEKYERAIKKLSNEFLNDANK